MEYDVEKIAFKSSNKVNIVHGKILKPQNGEIKGIIQFVHGMCEYFDKYTEFYEYMLSKGYIVAGHDNIGHGDSVNSENERGFFAKKDGYKFLIKDVNYMHQVVRKRYPNIPYFVASHSMGTFITRCYISKYYDDIDGAILLGTMGPQWAIEGGLQLANRLIDKKGDMYRSRKLDQLSFKFANLKFEPVNTKYDWTCSVPEIIEKHCNDKKARFIFTVSGFKDLFYLIKFCNDEKYIIDTPKKLPLLIMSGSDDPVGEDGFGARKVYEIYKKIGMKDVSFKLYKDCRHELLNEFNKYDIYDDILNWIDCVRFGEE